MEETEVNVQKEDERLRKWKMKPKKERTAKIFCKQAILSHNQSENVASYMNHQVWEFTSNKRLELRLHYNQNNSWNNLICTGNRWSCKKNYNYKKNMILRFHYGLNDLFRWIACVAEELSLPFRSALHGEKGKIKQNKTKSVETQAKTKNIRKEACGRYKTTPWMSKWIWPVGQGGRVGTLIGCDKWNCHIINFSNHTSVDAHPSPSLSSHERWKRGWGELKRKRKKDR